MDVLIIFGSIIGVTVLLILFECIFGWVASINSDDPKDILIGMLIFANFILVVIATMEVSKYLSVLMGN